MKDPEPHLWTDLPQPLRSGMGMGKEREALTLEEEDAASIPSP